ERTRDGITYVSCYKPVPQRTIALVYRPGSPLRSRYEQLAEAIRTQMQAYMETTLKQAV
ncbi:MAG: DNA-binding transcriptional regulator OxyR, partial [Pantoea sp.]|nr:DNA-binding transcriptional regulator OxyR [Pantoea sp.]